MLNLSLEDRMFLKEIAIRDLVLRQRITENTTVAEYRLILIDIKQEEKELGVTPFDANYMEVMTRDI